MAKKTPEPTRPPRARAFMVGIDLRSEPSLLTVDDSLAELSLLADTAGLEVVGETSQKLDHPHPETFIGSGKVDEVKALVEETQAELVILITNCHRATCASSRRVLVKMCRLLTALL
jgi:GTPase